MQQSGWNMGERGWSGDHRWARGMQKGIRLEEKKLDSHTNTTKLRKFERDVGIGCLNI